MESWWTTSNVASGAQLTELWLHIYLQQKRIFIVENVHNTEKKKTFQAFSSEKW